MSDKEKKQLMFAIPLLVLAAFMVYWFIIKQPQTGGGRRAETPTPTTEAPVTQPTPGGTWGTDTLATAEMETQVALASAEHGLSRELGRSDPFVPYVKYQKIEPGGLGGWAAMIGPPPTLPAVGTGYLLPPPPIDWVEEEHERRMVGMLHNGRIWAIYEKDGISQIVKPGDPVGDETVVAVGTDYLILRSLDGRERKVLLERMSGYEATGAGYSPRGVRAPAPGPRRPPARPRPPVL